MMLAIIVLFIATSSIILFSSQVIHQIKFTKKTESSMMSKYEVDAGIEIAISEIIKSLNVDVIESKVTENKKEYTVKTIKIPYIYTLNIDKPIYFQTEKYNIEITNDTSENKIEIYDNDSVDSISDSGNIKIVKLKKDDKSLDKFTIIYNINVKPKEKVTKEKKYRVEIELQNIIDSNTYGISYKFNEI